MKETYEILIVEKTTKKILISAVDKTSFPRSNAEKLWLKTSSPKSSTVIIRKLDK